jgi:hypothetical protein
MLAEQRFTELPPDSPAWRGVADELVRLLAGLENSRGLRRFLRVHDAGLRPSADLWGLVAWALLDFKEHKRVAQWMSDWSGRDDAESWMLNNLAIALRSLKRWSEAAAVAQRTRSMRRSPDTERLWPWLALEQAIDGNVAGANAVLDDLEGAELPDYLLHIMRAARAVLAVREDPVGGFAVARELLAASRSKMPRTGGFVQEAGACRRATGAVARSAASIWRWPWWLWQQVSWIQFG